MKRSESRKSTRANGKRQGARIDRSVDNVRRLHLVEGGRQAAKSGRRISGRPAPQKRAVPRAIRRRRRLAAIILMLLAAGLITYILLGSMMSYLQGRRDLSKAEAQLSQEKENTQALEDKKNVESSDEYVEGKARENGYVKPGEIPIIVLDQPSGETDGNPADSQSDTNTSQQSNH